jgi:3alpha(or 20beta)-hydroxysteroid dehydrogenase
MRLENKVAIVTGSTSGIGLATAKLFARQGAKVVLAARKENIAEQIVSDIKAAGGEAFFVHLEVTSLADWQALVAATKKKYGRLDILVNNAGVNTPVSFPKVDYDKWQQVMNVDVTGPMMGIQECAPLMKESGGGSIINIASLGGHYGTISTAYSTAKWALRGLSKCAAATYGDWGIRSNTVSPGFISDTNLTKKIEGRMAGVNPMAQMSFLNRTGEPIELANAVLFLASDDSSFVTGQEFTVDGGLDAGGIYAGERPMLKKMLAAKKQQ